jgi:hypothetical protein
MAFEASFKDSEDVKLFIENCINAIELDKKLLEELEEMKRIQVYYEAHIGKSVNDL